MNSFLMAEDYRQHKRLMYAALRDLARHGFRVPPGNAMDLIHDFFAEEWGKLRSSYDDARGTFAALLYTSFMRFARRRIIRESRLNAMLVDTMDREPIDPGSAELDYSIDRQALADAIARLPASVQKVLVVYADALSEREGARQLALSRHAYREAVLDGLRNVAIAMNRRSGLDELHWQFAKMLWLEERSLEDIRVTLQLTTTQVTRMRRQIADAIEKSIHLQDKRASHVSRESGMPAVPIAVKATKGSSD